MISISFRYIGIVPLAFTLLLLSYTQNAKAEAGVQASVGAYNYLTMAFVLLRQGVNPEDIRREVLDNVDYAAMNPSVQTLYRKLFQLTNAVIDGNKKIGTPSSSKTRVDMASATKSASDISKLFGKFAVGDYAGAAVSLFSLLSSSSSTSNSVVSSTVLKRHRDAISNLEFEISLARNALAKKLDIPVEKFVRTRDVEDYLDAKVSAGTSDAYFAKLSKLFAKSPSFYPVAWELAMQANQSHKDSDADFYAKAVISAVPRILIKNKARADAYAILGFSKYQAHAYSGAEEYFKAALKDQPYHQAAWTGLTSVAIATNKVAEAKQRLEDWRRRDQGNAFPRLLFAYIRQHEGASTDEVFSLIKQAVDLGFTDIPLIRRVFSNTPVSNTPEFEQLLGIKLHYAVKWNALFPDQLRITNTSPFDLSSVKFSVYYLEKPTSQQSGWSYLPSAKGMTVKYWPANQPVTINAYNSTKLRLKALRIELHADQGSLTHSIQVRNGHFSTPVVTHDDAP